MKLFDKVGTVHVLADVVGNYADHDHDDRYYTQAEVDAIIAANPGPTGAKGDPGDPGPQPWHVVWVAQSGGDFTTIGAALDAIDDGSATNRYLIKVAPGTHTEQVTLEDYVDIEGSGAGLTTVRLSDDLDAATMTGAGEPVGGLTAYAVNLSGVTGQVEFVGVSLLSVGGLSSTGLHAEASSGISIRDSVVTVARSLVSLGVSVDESTVELVGDEVTAGMAALYVVDSGRATVGSSELVGDAAVLLQTGGSAMVATSMIAGAVTGVPTCVGVYNAAYAPLNAACG